MLDAPLLEQLPDTLTIDHDGKAMPMREHPFVKEAKDFPSFVKSALDAHKEVGARVRIPGKDAKPEDVAAFKARLTEQGLLSAPPSKPEDYGIVKPEKLQDGQVWNEQAAAKLAAVLHQHGAPKALAADLLALHQEMVDAQAASFKEAGTGLQVSLEQGMAALKTEFGDKFNERKEQAGRLARQLFKSPEEIAFYERSGIANAPLFLAPLMRLAPLAMQDSAFLEAMAGSGSQAAASSARAEAVDIQRNRDNPKHALWVKGDKETRAYVDSLYERAAGKGQVEVT